MSNNGKQNVFFTKEQRDASRLRDYFFRYYFDKYKNLFIDSKTFEGLSVIVQRIIMSDLWDKGSSYCFSMVNIDESYLGGLSPELQKRVFDNATLLFCDGVPQNFGTYYEPTLVSAVSAIDWVHRPQGEQVNYRDVAVGYILPTKQAFKELVIPLINDIVDAKMTIRSNLFALRNVSLFDVNANNPQLAETLNGLIRDGARFGFVYSGEDDGIRYVGGSAPYNVDKLDDYIAKREAEIETMLGLENGGSIEKKERLLVDEANVSNVKTNAWQEMTLRQLKEYVDVINKLFNPATKIVVRNTWEMASMAVDKGGKDKPREGEDDGSGE